MKFRDQIAITLGLAVLMFSIFVGVPSYMRGRAFSQARTLDNRTVSVVATRFNLCGDVEIEIEDGQRILFRGHTPFAQYVYANVWRNEIVLPECCQLHFTLTEQPQITESWLKSGLLANEWEPSTWLEVELVDHF